MAVAEAEITVKLRTPHSRQSDFINSKAKRKIIRAGRRGGKTVGAAIVAVQEFLRGKRVLYGTPTSEQLTKFWFEVCRSLAEGIADGTWHVNNTEHIIEVVGTENRIRAKTCWNANTLRGDFAGVLILDEWQLMAEDTWDEVGAPMLLDNNGDAIFIYTPPSLYSSGVSKARDPRHAAKMFKTAEEDKTGKWEAFHFTSHDNPYISDVALGDITEDMTKDAYRREILAEDDDLSPSLLVYGMFNEKSQLINPYPIPETWPRYTGHDFGLANPAAVFVAVNPATAEYTVYDEYLPGVGKVAGGHVEEWQRRTKGLMVLRRVGGNQTTEEETRQLYGAHGWPISAPGWKEKNKQILITQGHMERNKIFVFKTCYRLRDELMNCLWDTAEDGTRLDKIKDEARYHLLACMRYLFSEFPLETVDNNSPAVVQDMRPSSRVKARDYSSVRDYRQARS